MASTALKPAKPKLALFDVEQSLLALLDFEPQQQDEQFREVIQSGLDRAIDKRQQVGEFFLFLKDRQQAFKKEIKRLRVGLKATTSSIERVSNNGVYVILSLGEDDRGELRKLKGHTLTLGTKRNPKSVDIVNPDAVPDDFKVLTAAVPMKAWRELASLVKSGALAEIASPETCLAVEQATEGGEVSISKSAIAKALDEGKGVSGATWKPNSYKLTVR